MTDEESSNRLRREHTAHRLMMTAINMRATGCEYLIWPSRAINRAQAHELITDARDMIATARDLRTELGR